MDIDGIKSFLAVAREKSISKAALSLHMTQPALSNRLRRLEQGLGIILLERSWDGVKLTEKGSYFLPYAIQLVQDLQDASTVLALPSSQQPHAYKEVIHRSNQLLIGIDDWLSHRLIGHITSALKHRYPELKYRFITKWTSTIVDLVYHHSMHAGIHFYNDTRNGLLSFPVLHDELYIIYNSSLSPISDTEENIFKQLRHLPFLLFDNPIFVPHRRTTSHIFQKYNIHDLQIVDNLYAAAALISEGVAYTILPQSCCFVFQQLEDVNLTLSPLHDAPSMEISIIYPPTTPFIEEIEFVRDTIISLN